MLGMAHKYGGQHQRIRFAAIRSMTEGQPCARCALRGVYHPLSRAMPSRLLHLDHDGDGGYLGLSYARCTLAHGGQVGRAVQLAALPPKTRVCPCCGKAFEPEHGQVTCGARPCITALRASRRAWEPDPVAPAASGRRW